MVISRRNYHFFVGRVLRQLPLAAAESVQVSVELLTAIRVRRNCRVIRGRDVLSRPASPCVTIAAATGRFCWSPSRGPRSGWWLVNRDRRPTSRAGFLPLGSLPLRMTSRWRG